MKQYHTNCSCSPSRSWGKQKQLGNVYSTNSVKHFHFSHFLIIFTNWEINPFSAFRWCWSHMPPIYRSLDSSGDLAVGDTRWRKDHQFFSIFCEYWVSVVRQERFGPTWPIRYHPWDLLLHHICIHARCAEASRWWPAHTKLIQHSGCFPSGMGICKNTSNHINTSRTRA